MNRQSIWKKKKCSATPSFIKGYLLKPRNILLMLVIKEEKEEKKKLMLNGWRMELLKRSDRKENQKWHFFYKRHHQKCLSSSSEEILSFSIKLKNSWIIELLKTKIPEYSCNALNVV